MAKDAKKKKRSRKDSETKDDLACPGEERDSDSPKVKDRRKSLKKKNRKDVGAICQDNEAVTDRKKHCDVEASSDVLEEIPVVKKKKKKHRKSKTETVVAEPGASDVETNESTSIVVLSERKKRKKHKKIVAEESLNEHELCAGREPDNDEEELNANSVVHKKGKKRVGDGSANEATPTKVKKHKPKNGGDDGVSNVAEVNGIEKRKKKRTKVEHVQLDDSPVHPKVKTSKKEKKQKKRDKNSELLSTSEPNGDADVPVEKNRKKHVEREDKCAKVCDESTGQELGETPGTKQPKDGATSRFLGQWGTAELDTGERQNKFLRLLGGFKASSGQKAAPGRHCVNSALNASGENQLNKTLETQFDNAMNYRVNMQRGGGLGYSAPPGENKKFHIDSTSSKSLKFDD